MQLVEPQVGIWAGFSGAIGALEVAMVNPAFDV